jgi:hypothetical protein
MQFIEAIDLSVLSEGGFDHALSEGIYNALADDADLGFESCWWSEIQRFEKAIHGTFSSEAVFVSDNIPAGKRFGIEITGPAKLAEVFRFLFSYLEKNHPDGSVVIGDLFAAPIPAARLLISERGCVIDQDATAWFLHRSRVEGVSCFNTQLLQKSFSTTEISSFIPWLDGKNHISLQPSEFWSVVYSGREFLPMMNEQGEDWQSYKFGHSIIRRLSDCIVELGVEDHEFYLSGSLPNQRVVKIECSRGAFTEELFESVTKLVRKMDRTWSVRFSVFERLDTTDSYLGGVIYTHKGELFSEGNG